MTESTDIDRGTRFGHLVVLGPGASDERGAAGWICKCDCGKTNVWAMGRRLRKGEKTSCGCKGKGTKDGK